MLVESPSTVRRGGTSSNDKNAGNSLPDISFLDVGICNFQKPTLQASHFTLTVIGWDHYKWSAFAFAKRGTPVEATEEEEDDEENDLDSNDHMDAIAGGSGDNNVMAADQPIWDPRAYWLIIVEKYVRQSTEEWCKLVYHIESSFVNWVREFKVYPCCINGADSNLEKQVQRLESLLWIY